VCNSLLSFISRNIIIVLLLHRFRCQTKCAALCVRSVSCAISRVVLLSRSDFSQFFRCRGRIAAATSVHWQLPPVIDGARGRKRNMTTTTTTTTKISAANPFSLPRVGAVERCNCYYCPARAENNSINAISVSMGAWNRLIITINIIPPRCYCYSKRTITRYNIILLLLLLFISYIYRYGVSETNIRQLGRSCFSCKYKHENRGTPPLPIRLFWPNNTILLSHQDFGRSRAQLRPKFQIVGPIARMTTAAAYKRETVFYLVQHEHKIKATTGNDYFTVQCVTL